MPADAFDAGRRHAWAPGNRFRMYFGGKKAGPTKRSGKLDYGKSALQKSGTRARFFQRLWIAASFFQTLWTRAGAAQLQPCLGMTMHCARS